MVRIIAGIGLVWAVATAAWAQDTGGYDIGGIPAAILIGVLAVAGVLLAGFAYVWKNRQPVPRYTGGPELESSQYEQVQAELQGIRLMIESGDGRTYLPKISRLVNIFAERAGIEGAREMGREDLSRSIDAYSEMFTAAQIEVLERILERCEASSIPEKGKLDFDPVELVTDFQRIISQIEEKEQF